MPQEIREIIKQMTRWPIAIDPRDTEIWGPASTSWTSGWSCLNLGNNTRSGNLYDLICADNRLSDLGFVLWAEVGAITAGSYNFNLQINQANYLVSNVIYSNPRYPVMSTRPYIETHNRSGGDVKYYINLICLSRRVSYADLGDEIPQTAPEKK